MVRGTGKEEQKIGGPRRRSEVPTGYGRSQRKWKLLLQLRARRLCKKRFANATLMKKAWLEIGRSEEGNMAIFTMPKAKRASENQGSSGDPEGKKHNDGTGVDRNKDPARSAGTRTTARRIQERSHN